MLRVEALILGCLGLGSKAEAKVLIRLCVMPKGCEGAVYPGSGPLELVLFVLQLVAQRLLFLLQLCDPFL